ncbi:MULTISPECIES: alpha/beta fold hydrolase [unclassified Streptomyces]|uniref:alpha/beta fold hydrolase n=1 Tax=unclassified Streptomyces TaxID=2593676 RepID=UPI000DDC077A|nr:MULTISPECIES: alpha/beta hydrolase [unclassified Streptomyces]QZZ31403.1 alpha/beta hydrolase [Streptomyces sp. ST1015]
MGDVRYLTGVRGRIAVHEWAVPRPRYVAVLVHGYGEHLGRYEELAGVLRGHGAAVLGPDHAGHGLSDGERVLVGDFEDVVTDVEAVVSVARESWPGVPLVVVGHSMGGLIAARLAQRSAGREADGGSLSERSPGERRSGARSPGDRRSGDRLSGGRLAALVLSGPVIGDWALPGRLLAYDEIPDVPVSPAALSRDPAVGAAYMADPLVWHGAMKRATLEAFRTTLGTVASGGGLGGLPVLWLHGEDDRLVPLAESRPGVARLTEGGSLTSYVYPGARHEVFAETNRAEVFGDLTRFLDSAVR